MLNTPKLLLTFLLSLSLLACKDTANLPDNPYDGSIQLESTSYHLPLNEYGQAMLTTRTDNGTNVTDITTFYADGKRLNEAVFTPTYTGVFQITGIYQGAESNPVEIHVSEARNKKVLIELFTSRSCGWCPWIGTRLDELHRSRAEVIGYTIHLNDELQISEAELLQQALSVNSTPTIRFDRGYVRDYAASREIVPLLDSIDRQLSIQPPLELSVESSLQAENLIVDVWVKVFEEVDQDLYLTVLLVEDRLTTYNQANIFSGESYEDCPYTELPNPIPVYENLNVLRQVVSEPLGDPIQLEANDPQLLGSYQLMLDPAIDEGNTFLIALIHGQADIDLSSVLNAQVARVGEDVGFEE